MSKERKREFLMLAQTYNRAKHGIGGYMMSEKLDGQRCFWDGGVSRGQLKADIYWANTAKDERYIIPQIATGLWSRYGNVIHAHDTWLDQLPPVPLDGELYLGNGSKADRQRLRTIVGGLHSSLSSWLEVDYRVFEMPPRQKVLGAGVLKGTNFTKEFIVPEGTIFDDADIGFIDKQWPAVTLVQQERLPQPTAEAEARLDEYHTEICARGGEGVMLRAPFSKYECARSYSLLKVKKLDDMEGTVIGYTTGRETDKGSRLLGKMGALILQLSGNRRLELSGFTDEERRLNDPTWAKKNPGVECAAGVVATHFPLGSSVTFMYRGLTNDGIPNEARYKRPWEVE